MGLSRPFAQFQHVAQHRNLPCLSRDVAQYADSCLHGLWAGVIYIINYFYAASFKNIKPHFPGIEKRDAPDNVFHGHTELNSGGNSRKRIVYIMDSRHGNMHFILRPAHHNFKIASVFPKGFDIAGLVITALLHAVKLGTVVKEAL